MSKHIPDNVIMKEHQELIKQLLAEGMTQAGIGAAIGKSQAWVGAVLAGSYGDIKWSDGIKLRNLAGARANRIKDAA